MSLDFFQKQYMFVYRAIMEMAQFGDTEIEASKMKEAWLKYATSDGAKRLEEEFERLADNVEDKKAVSVGQGWEPSAVSSFSSRQVFQQRF